MKPFTVRFGIVVITISVYFGLDTNPSLYFAEKYLKHVRPSLLHEVFDGESVTLITGASDGIGEGLAYYLCAKTNTDLILMARRYEKLERVKQQCLERSKKKERQQGDFEQTTTAVVLIVGDVQEDEEKQKTWLLNALKELQAIHDESSNGTSSPKRRIVGVDNAFLNAGRGYAQPVRDTHVGLIREIMEVNFLGAVTTLKAVLSTYPDDVYDYSSLEKKKKHVVAVSSVASKLPVALAAGYSASKAAMDAFFNSLRAESSNYMRVTTVVAGPILTGIVENSIRDNEKYIPLSDTTSVRDKSNKMSVERSVELIIAGMVSEPWWVFHELLISNQPVLFYAHLGWLFPDVVKYLGKSPMGCGGSTLCKAQNEGISNKY